MKTIEVTQQQKELYDQFRAYNAMDDIQRLSFKATLLEAAQKRTSVERENYLAAIQSNVGEVSQKLKEIEQQLGTSIKDR